MGGSKTVDKVDELLKEIDHQREEGEFWQTCSHESTLRYEQPCGELVRLARLGAAVEALPHGYALERDATGEWNIYWVAHNGGGGPTLNFIGYGSTAEEAMRLHCNSKT
jgi:hypothetical protein